EAGYIWRYDLASGQTAPIPIEVKEDFASGRPAFVDASKHIESVNLAPDGERAIVVARGDLFSVPMKEGTARNLSKSSNAHERDAIWSPDGKWIAYNSDLTGENELYVRSQDGKGQPQQVTRGTDTYYYRQTWSPDSKKLLWADRLQRLRYVDVNSNAVTQVDQDKWGEIQSNDWSHDSQWIDWAHPEEKKSPSPTQKPSPTPTPELKPKKPVVVKVDLDGIHDRISGVEIVPGNYSDIRVVDDRIFYLRRTVADQEDEDEADQDSRDRKAHLCSYSLEDRKEIVLGDVNAYQISADGKRMLVKIKKDYAIIDLPKDKLETKDHELKLAG